MEGFYFLLYLVVGIMWLMDIKPLNWDVLAVLQTDFLMMCENSLTFLMLVNKFYFFSGWPINVEETCIIVRNWGTEIYMLAFLSLGLIPEELYRLKPSGSGSNHHELKNTKLGVRLPQVSRYLPI